MFLLICLTPEFRLYGEEEEKFQLSNAEAIIDFIVECVSLKTFFFLVTP